MYAKYAYNVAYNAATKTSLYYAVYVRNPENLDLALNGIGVIRQVQRAYQKIDWLVIKINLC